MWFNIINLFPSLIAFLVTASCIWLLRPLAIRLELVDSPHGRKQHQGHIPLIGGIAMFFGFLFALLTLPISLVEYRSLIAGCALLVFIGVLDDFHELSARPRLVAQIVAALLMMTWGGVSLHDLGNLLFFKDIVLHNWSLPFTVIAAVGLINAVNMIDGVDGLAGGVVLIGLAFLLFLAISAGQFTAVYILSLVLAIVLAFLIFNFPFPGRKHALVFMGDAGSMFLGFVLVWFLIDLSQGAHRVASPATMLWLVAVPLFDIVGITIHRLRKRMPLFAPDREHLHHLLHNYGFKNWQITFTICALALLCGLIGVSANHLGISEGVIFVGFLICFVLYMCVQKYLRAFVRSIETAE